MIDLRVNSCFNCKLYFFRKPVPSPEASSTSSNFSSSSVSKTTDDINTGRPTHVTKATFKPSSSNEVLSYATMPRGSERKDADMKRWRDLEENNNEDAFISPKGLSLFLRNLTILC